jgi:membrane-bound serine protease (ClpP class)
MGGSQLGATEREKIETYLRTEFRDSAKRNGYNQVLAEAMVTITLTVYKMRNTATGEIRYVNKEQFEKLTGKKPEDSTDEGEKEKEEQETHEVDWQSRRSTVGDFLYGSRPQSNQGTLIFTQEETEDKGEWVKVKTVVSDKQLLTMTDEEALEYGFAKKIVSNEEELADFYNVSYPMTFFEASWSEEVVRFLNSTTMTSLLFLVALLALYMELQTPGIGLPGAVAVICFAILFGSKYFIGLAEWWEIALFFVGVALVLVEIFVIPGFGIAGISGIACIVISLLAMVMPHVPGPIPLPATASDWEIFERGLFALLIGFSGFILGAILLAKYFPRLPYSSRLIRVPSKSVTSAADVPGSFQSGVKAGDRGQSLSLLRPAGKARIDGKLVDVVTRGEYIQSKTPIEVIEVAGSQVVVKAVGEEKK